MSARSLFDFLRGKPDALRRVARSKRSLWIGFLFVLSAALAREYDAEDLLRQPWHLLVPVGASLAAAGVLYLGVFLFGATRAGWPFLGGFRALLACFWMTAPLAWLYAIPYERFLTPVGALNANLVTLLVVATWRVVQMARTLEGVFRFGRASALFGVLAFSDLVLLGALYTFPVPLVGFMSGIRELPELEQRIGALTFQVSALAMLALPLLWLVAGVALLRRKPSQREPDEEPVAQAGERGLERLAWGAIAVGLVLALFAQPEQRRRSEVEGLLRGGRVAEAMERLSATAPSDYPPQWDPPPRVTYGEHEPTLVELRDGMLTRWPSGWAEQLYARKIRFVLMNRRWSTDDERLAAFELGRRAGWTEVVEELEARERASAEWREVSTRSGSSGEQER